MIAFAIGVIITIATYAFAVSRGGGTYLVSYGPMVAGLLAMVRGGIDMSRERRAGGPAAGGSLGGAQAVGQPGFGGQGFGGQGFGGQGFGGQGFDGPGFDGQGGWQGGSPQAAFQPAGAPMSAQAMPGAGAQAGMWGGSDYAGYGAASTANTANAMRSAPNTAPPAANWYPDPQNPAMLRWWDGQGWTGHIRPYN
jgi:hypothetical protein